MKLNLIFTLTSDNYLIQNSCKDNIQHFNCITTDIFNNSYVVMCMNTWELLPEKLSDRINVVISKQQYKGDFDLCFNSLNDFFKSVPYDDKSEIFIIGGKSLIEECLTNYKNIIDNVYISIVTQKIINNLYIDDLYINNLYINNLEPYLKNMCKKNEVSIYHYKFPKHQECQYLQLLQKTMISTQRQTRNAKTFSIFSEKLSFDLTKGFPLLTTKKVFLRGIFEELLFFIRGQTNSKILESKGVNIWKPNTSKEFIEKCGLPYEEGDMGPLYGFNWKYFGAEYLGCDIDYTEKGYNQIDNVLDLLINDPCSRRILLTDYNPSIAKQGVLYPCHSIIIQFYISEIENNKMVSMNMYQRSVDEFLGLPFNIASNALLLHLICNTLNVKTEKQQYYPDKLNILMGDCHIYESHLDAVKEQLQRIPYDLPQIHIKTTHDLLENYKWEDIEIINYNCHPIIKADMIP